LPDSLSTLVGFATPLNVSIGEFARQPVNDLGRLFVFIFSVSIGEFARQPVNGFLQNSRDEILWFQLANLPDSLSTILEVVRATITVSIGEFARQPVNINLMLMFTLCFNWRICPTACQPQWD